MNEMTYNFVGLNDSEVVTIQNALLHLRMHFLLEKRQEEENMVNSLIKKIEEVYHE
jgi:hypothetical protein